MSVDVFDGLGPRRIKGSLHAAMQPTAQGKAVHSSQKDQEAKFWPTPPGQSPTLPKGRANRPLKVLRSCFNNS